MYITWCVVKAPKPYYLSIVMQKLIVLFLNILEVRTEEVWNRWKMMQQFCLQECSNAVMQGLFFDSSSPVCALYTQSWINKEYEASNGRMSGIIMYAMCAGTLLTCEWDQPPTKNKQCTRSNIHGSRLCKIQHFIQSTETYSVFNSPSKPQIVYSLEHDLKERVFH